MKDISLYKNMSELGAGTRGSSLGADAMVTASHYLGKDLFKRFPFNEIDEQNEKLFEEVRQPFAIHLESILNLFENSSKEIEEAIKSEYFPILVSGDHSNAASTIAAIKAALPSKRLGVIWIDAHGDLHSPFTTPSGNVHGMPLAISLGLDNLENQINTPDEKTCQIWKDLKNLRGICPKIDPSDLVFFAVRDIEKPEKDLLSRHDIKNFSVEELRFQGISQCIEEAKTILKDCDLIYISFDVDSMDCNLISHGTGTPVENGLSMEEAQSIMVPFMNDERLVCLEFVEINPTLDEKGNKMAETAVRILDNLIRVRQGDKK